MGEKLGEPEKEISSGTRRMIGNADLFGRAIQRREALNCKRLLQLLSGRSQERIVHPL